MTPEDIVFMEVESESVVIQWTVAYISYSPETYVVQYGTSRETLVHNSSRRASEVGTTTYSVPLSGLRDYVQVLATNTALRYSRGTVESFTTALLRASQHCPPYQVCASGYGVHALLTTVAQRLHYHAINRITMCSAMKWPIHTWTTLTLPLISSSRKS